MRVVGILAMGPGSAIRRSRGAYCDWRLGRARIALYVSDLEPRGWSRVHLPQDHPSQASGKFYGCLLYTSPSPRD